MSKDKQKTTPNDVHLHLKKYLPHGAATIIANKFNLSVGHVSCIIRGERNNPQVLQAAIEMAEENKLVIDANNQKLKELQS